MRILDKQYWLFWAGLFLIGISLLLSFTPLHLQIEKMIGAVPDEYYPEYFWLLIALPVSVVTMIAGFVFGFAIEKKKSKEGKQ